METTLIRASQIFFAIFIISIPLTRYGAKHRSLISNSLFFQYLNTIFVTEYGVLWLTGVYWSYSIFSWASSEKLNIRYLANRLLKYILYLIFAVFFNAWFFGPLIVERLNVATGGHCTGTDTSIKSMSQCISSPVSLWVNGFDLSGHYFFLITLSLLLVDTIFSRKPSAGVSVSTTEEASFWKINLSLVKTFHIIAGLIQRFTIALLALWLIEFCITSIFFHTLGEKASGLLGIPIALGVSFISDKFCSFQLNLQPDSDV